MRYFSAQAIDDRKTHFIVRGDDIQKAGEVIASIEGPYLATSTLSSGKRIKMEVENKLKGWFPLEMFNIKELKNKPRKVARLF
jgi:hypothetical protein